MQDVYEKVRANPKFNALVSKRNSYAFVLTFLMMVVYFGYILLIAFNKPLLAEKIGAGVTSLGIPLGLGVILFTIAITAVYVRRANTEFDAEAEQLLKESGK